MPRPSGRASGVAPRFGCRSTPAVLPGGTAAKGRGRSARRRASRRACCRPDPAPPVRSQAPRRPHGRVLAVAPRAVPASTAVASHRATVLDACLRPPRGARRAPGPRACSGPVRGRGRLIREAQARQRVRPGEAQKKVGIVAGGEPLHPGPFELRPRRAGTPAAKRMARAGCSPRHPERSVRRSVQSTGRGIRGRAWRGAPRGSSQPVVGRALARAKKIARTKKSGVPGLALGPVRSTTGEGSAGGHRRRPATPPLSEVRTHVAREPCSGMSDLLCGTPYP